MELVSCRNSGKSTTSSSSYLFLSCIACTNVANVEADTSVVPAFCMYRQRFSFQKTGAFGRDAFKKPLLFMRCS